MKKRIYYYEESEIEKLLLYRKIVEVTGDTLILDNGTRLTVYPNEGCGGCSSGWYDIVELNKCDNVITSVLCVCEPLDGWAEYSYQIFVYSENTETKILQVDGTDGNGYYGSGYSITVEVQHE